MVAIFTDWLKIVVHGSRVHTWWSKNPTTQIHSQERWVDVSKNTNCLAATMNPLFMSASEQLQVNNSQPSERKVISQMRFPKGQKAAGPEGPSRMMTRNGIKATKYQGHCGQREKVLRTGVNRCSYRHPRKVFGSQVKVRQGMVWWTLRALSSTGYIVVAKDVHMRTKPVSEPATIEFNKLPLWS